MSSTLCYMSRISGGYVPSLERPSASFVVIYYELDNEDRLRSAFIVGIFPFRLVKQLQEFSKSASSGFKRTIHAQLGISLKSFDIPTEFHISLS